jgi:hypothetical protein
MNKNYTIVALVIFLAAVGVAVYGFTGKKTAEETFTPPAPASDSKSALTRINEEDAITVAVTPVTLSGDPLEFEIVMDTHAGSLDADLETAASLKDSAGKTYAPLAVEGDPPGGHHRSALLKFPKPDSSGQITLILRGVGEVPERTFSWNP